MPATLRILMLNYDFPPLGSGGSLVVHGLSKELVRLGHAVDVVTMGFKGLPPEEVVNGIRVHRVPCLRRRRHVCTIPEAASYVAGAGRTIRRLLAAHTYDVVHAHFILPGGFMAQRLRKATGIPYVITAHGSDVPGYNPHRFHTAHHLLAPLWQGVVRDAASIICPSAVLQALIADRSRLAKTRVIPNGIDTAWFRPTNGAPQVLRILIVARLVELKGVQHALAALKNLGTDYEFHIVGDGPYLPTLRELARDHGERVRFWGWLDHHSEQLRKLYETSTIFLLPSQSENFPVALLEAMASGLAIITTSGTGCAEVVGDTALLVPPKDPGAIRDALHRLGLEPDLGRRLGHAARIRIEMNFGWKAVARRYVETYSGAMQAGARGGMP